MPYVALVIAVLAMVWQVVAYVRGDGAWRLLLLGFVSSAGCLYAISCAASIGGDTIWIPLLLAAVALSGALLPGLPGVGLGSLVGTAWLLLHLPLFTHDSVATVVIYSLAYPVFGGLGWILKWLQGKNKGEQDSLDAELTEAETETETRRTTAICGQGVDGALVVTEPLPIMGNQASREQELYNRQRKLYSLMQLFQQLSTVRDLEVIRYNVVRIASLETDSPVVMLIAAYDAVYRFTGSCGLSEASLKACVGNISQSRLSEVVSGNRTMRFDKDSFELPGLAEPISCMLAVPLADSTGRPPFGILVVANNASGEYSAADEEFLLLLASEAAISISNIRLYGELELSYHEVIQALAQAIEAKDPYTHGHVGRVETIAVQLAKALNLPSNTVVQIAKAAILHDVGKISVPDSILMKPGSLTPEEAAVMKTHVTIAPHILKDIHSLSKEVIDMIIHHHERFDGKGYPDGLAAENIPVGAHIIAIADSFDAMTSDRPYRKGFSREEALKRMEENAGIQFDPRLLSVFLALCQRQGPDGFSSSGSMVDTLRQDIKSA